MKKKRIWIYLLALGLLLIGCSDPQPYPGPSSPSIIPPGGAEPAQAEPGPSAEAPGPAGLRDLPPVERALTNLSVRLDIPVDEIEVLEVKEVTWPDSSLGCAQPGQAYLQVLTPGYQVLLGTAHGQFVYHTDNKQTVVLCKEGGMEQKPGSPGAIQPGLEPFADQAVADLGNRLGVRVEEVEVLAASPMVWPDGSLGCPQPDMRYTQVQVEGYLITLMVGKEEYAYHGGGGQGPFLCEQP